MTFIFQKCCKYTIITQPIITNYTNYKLHKLVTNTDEIQITHTNRFLTQAGLLSSAYDIIQSASRDDDASGPHGDRNDPYNNKVVCKQVA